MDSTRWQALQRLATVAEREGKYVEAFKHWQAWETQDECANCAWAMEEHRDTRMLYCLSQIADDAVVVQLCLEDAVAGRGDCARKLLVSMYSEAHQLDDLARLIKELEKRESEAARLEPEQRREETRRWKTDCNFLTSAVKIEQLRQKRDADGILASVSDPQASDEVKEHAGEVASSLEGGAVKKLHSPRPAFEMKSRRPVAGSLPKQWNWDARR
jgi:hypothetical protein